MTRELPTDNSGTEYIQYRGYQSQVVVDDFGIQFGMTTRSIDTPGSAPNHLVHEPLPVGTGDGGVAPEVAEALVEGELSNPLIAYGVACEFLVDDDDGEDEGEGEVCGEVFDTPEALNGHLRMHYEDEDEAEAGDGETEDVAPTESTDTSPDTPDTEGDNA